MTNSSGTSLLASTDDLEGDIVEVAGLLVVFRFHLRDGGLALGTPDRRRLLAVLAALLVQVDEGELRDALDARLDRLVGLVPVDGDAERLDVLGEPLLVVGTYLSTLRLKLSAFEVLVTDVQFGFRQALGGDSVVVVAERKKR